MKKGGNSNNNIMHMDTRQTHTLTINVKLYYTLDDRDLVMRNYIFSLPKFLKRFVH